MSIKTDWQGLKFDESKQKYGLVFAQEDKRRICSVRCCRNPKTEEVYYLGDKLCKFRRRTCNKCRTRLYRANNPIKDAYRGLRSSAKKRNIQFTVTYSEFEQLVNKTDYIAKKGSTQGSLHIDRIDPEIGYCAGNLQILTCSENVAKGNRERFIKDKKFNNSTKDEDPF